MTKTLQDVSLIILATFFFVNVVAEYIKNFRQDAIVIILLTAIILGVIDFVLLKTIFKKGV